MRIRLVFATLVLASILFPAADAAAQTSAVLCDPHTTGFTGSCVDYGCTTSGESTMDGNKQNLVACLDNGSGILVWKAMTAGGKSCYTDYGLPAGLPVGSSCVVSGFTVKGSQGIWGYCFIHETTAPAKYWATYRPPGGGGGTCDDGLVWGVHLGTANMGEAYLCCQN
ncbi:MAG: hypothetical protein PHY92_08190 [Alphaproteobacteria bacterium]|nr:hypothetical protein [Alphaproteobacteria bacterium]